ncbi:hypothetical protein HYU50_04770 [Candidatus Woesearchaeota archaeon]|nr:hypothetical protein [Candidatus Woesearchaeota archaeon]
MKVKLMFVLSVLAIFLLSSCAYEQPVPAAPKVYVVDESMAAEKGQPKTFVVEENAPLAWNTETKEKRSELNKIRALREDKDEQEEFYYESTYKNVRRIVDDELVVGYKKELDNPDFKEVVD